MTEVLADGFAATECPRWHDERLWFSDMHGHAVYAVTETGRLETITNVNGPGGIGFLPDGRMLVVSQRDRQVLRLDPDGLVVHADLTELGASWINDMWVDAVGRAYVGEMGFDIHGFLKGDGTMPCFANLYVVEPDGRVSVGAGEMGFPNGIVLSGDSTTLIVAESLGFQLTAFDIAADGSLGNRRVWADLGFPPDGIAPDAQGRMWVTDPNAARVVRVAEGGEVSAAVDTERKPLSCALGGADGQTLFVCTTDNTDPDEAPELRSSRIEMVKVQ